MVARGDRSALFAVYNSDASRPSVNLSRFSLRGCRSTTRIHRSIDRRARATRIAHGQPLAACCCSYRHQPCIRDHPNTVVPASVKDRRVDRRIDREGLLC